MPRAFEEERLTFVRAPEHDLECVLVRGGDIAKLLDRGHVDAAIGSSILFEEYGSPNLVQVAALPIGRCRLSLMTRASLSWEPGGRICTRYPKTTRRLLPAFDHAWEICVLSGCVESALFLGLSDAIADIVDTGWTMRALSLVERSVLCHIHHGIWMHPDRMDRLERLQHVMPEVPWAAV